MHGDFSRLTYTTAPLDTDAGFAAVLGLQGRLTLEADANENVAILAHFLRTLVTDLVGPGAGPAADAGFEIKPEEEPAGTVVNLLIGGGHYYVGGLLVRIAPSKYVGQPYLQTSLDELRTALQGPTIAYLKVWERLITAVEDPSIREVALGSAGPDTTARSKVVWQVLLARDPAGATADPPQSRDDAMLRWTELEKTLRPATQGRLRARTPSSEATAEDSLCALSPDARYRGVENQLYRVEIHSAGEIGPDLASPPTLPPTFKWSRDNGSVVFPIEQRNGAEVTVTTLGRDDRLALDVGDWVELVDDHSAFSDKPADLRQVADIDPTERLVTLDADPVRAATPGLHPFLRRWDQTPERKQRGDDDAVVADDTLDGWMDLEDGIQVKFEPGSYRSGDYWTIPARVETGDIIWPSDPVDPRIEMARPPEGITSFYAPLAYIQAPGQAPIDMRCLFPTLACGPVARLRPAARRGQRG
jgi:hypothetical protein